MKSYKVPIEKDATLTNRAAGRYGPIKLSINDVTAGDYATALQIQDKLMPLHQAIFTEPGLVGVKYAMSRLDLCSEEVRLPLTGLSDETRALVEAGLKHAELV